MSETSDFGRISNQECNTLFKNNTGLNELHDLQAKEVDIWKAGLLNEA